MEEIKVVATLQASAKLREFIKSGHQFQLGGVDCYTPPPFVLAPSNNGMALLEVPFMVDVKKEGQHISISVAVGHTFHSFQLNEEQFNEFITKLT